MMTPRNDYGMDTHFSYPGVFNLFARWSQDDGELEIVVRQAGKEHRDTLVIRRFDHVWHINDTAPDAKALVATRRINNQTHMLATLGRFDPILGR